MTTWPARQSPPLPEFGAPNESSFLPWILVVIAFLLFLPVIPQLNPSYCFEKTSNSDREPGTTPHNDRVISSKETITLLPAGIDCGEAIVDGKRRSLDHRSWLPPIAVARSLIVFLVGWIRPPTKDWRNLAIFLTVPALMLGLCCLILLADQGHVPARVGDLSFGALAFIVLGLPPGAVTYTFVSAMRDNLTHRLAWFFGSWASWSALFASGFVLAALT